MLRHCCGPPLPMVWLPTRSSRSGSLSCPAEMGSELGQNADCKRVTMFLVLFLKNKYYGTYYRCQYSRILRVLIELPILFFKIVPTRIWLDF